MSVTDPCALLIRNTVDMRRLRVVVRIKSLAMRGGLSEATIARLLLLLGLAQAEHNPGVLFTAAEQAKRANPAEQTSPDAGADFVQVPVQILRLQPSQLLVYASLLREGPWYRHGVAALARDCGLGPRRIGDILRELEDLGLVLVDRRRGETSSVRCLVHVASGQVVDERTAAVS